MNNKNKCLIFFLMILCICLIVPASFASEDISLSDSSQDSLSTGLDDASIISDSDSAIETADSNLAGSADSNLGVETADSQDSVLKDSLSMVYVNATGGNDENDGSGWTNAYKTIGNALNNVDSDGTIILDNGVYYLNETLGINKNVTIRGTSQNGTIIDASTIDSSTIRRVISITSNCIVNIDLLTIRNGWMDPAEVQYGAGINNLGTLSLDSVSVINCSAYNTGGVDNSGTLTVNNCYFANNSALGVGGNKNRGRDAGAISNMGTATVTNSYFTDNYASGNGAGIKNQGTNLYVNNCTFVNSIASTTNGYGGAIYGWATPTQVYNSTFINSTCQYGGAIGFDQNMATVGVVYKIIGCVFINNTQAVRGGAIYIDSAQDSEINDNIFINSSASLVGNQTPDGSVIGTGAFTGHYGLTNVSIENNYWGSTDASGFDSSLITSNFADPSKYVDFTAPSTYVVFNVSADKTELQSGEVSTITIGFVNNDGTAVTSGLPASIVTASSSSGTLSEDEFLLSENPVVITYTPSGTSTQDTVVISLNGVTVSIPMAIAAEIYHVYVNATGGNDENEGTSWNKAVKTISRALDIVEADGTVYIADGTYSANSITLSKNVEFVGESQNGTIIDGQSHMGFTIELYVSVNFTDLTLQNFSNSGGDGAAIENRGDLIVTRVSFLNNLAGYGAAIDNGVGYYSNLIVYSSYFENNTASGGTNNDGGAISSNGADTVVIYDSVFVNNSATRNGGAIKNQGTKLIIDRSSFINCYSTNMDDSYGGAVYLWSCDARISNSTFFNNSAQWGGAIGGSSRREDLVVNIMSSAFINNTQAVNGGAVYLTGLDDFEISQLSYNIFVNNKASYGNSDGTAIYGTDVLTIDNNNWFGNTAENTELDSSLFSGDITLPTEWLVLAASADSDSIKTGSSHVITVDLTKTQLNNEIDGSLIPQDLSCSLKASEGTIDVENVDLVNGKATVTYTAGENSGSDIVEVNVTSNTFSTILASTDLDLVIIPDLSKVYVNATGGDDANEGTSWVKAVQTISHALSIVEDDGIIYIADGTYTVSPTTLSKNVEFVGESQNGTVIDGGSRAGFTINNGKTIKISEMTFTAFAGNYGGVFEVNGILCVENVTFKNNRANNGGSAIDIGGATGSINVTNCYFDSNYAGRDGGALSSYDYGEVNVVNSTFINCSAGRNGGAIAIKSGNNYYKVVGCTFIDDYCTNLGNSYGGAIYAWSSNFIVDDCIFDNCSGQWGGAIGADGSSWTLSTNITGCLFMDNVNAVKGGAIYIDCFNTVNINYNVFVNSAASYGSADNAVISSGSKTKTSINLDNNWFGNTAEDAELDSSLIVSSLTAPTEWLVLDSTTISGFKFVGDNIPITVSLIKTQAGNVIDGSELPQDIPVIIASSNGTASPAETVLTNGEAIVTYVPAVAGENVVTSTIYDVDSVLTFNAIEHLDSVYVNASGDDSNTGADWDNALSSFAIALEIVTDGGNIYIADGVNDLQSAITINKNVNFIGESQNGTVIDGQSHMGFTIASGTSVNFTDLTLQNFSNSGGDGAAIENLGNLIVTRVSFLNNLGGYGAAIDNGYYSGSNLTVYSSYFENNTASGGTKNDGGAISSNGADTVAIYDSVFVNNGATRNGGAIKNQATKLIINGSSFIDCYSINMANSYGGAVYLWSCEAEISNSTFINNSAQWGGAIGGSGSRVDLKTNITSCTFINNTQAVRGGAVYLTNIVAGSSELNYNLFINNKASYSGNDGTAIYSSGLLVIGDNNWFGNNNTDTELDDSLFNSDVVLPNAWLILNSSVTGTKTYLGTGVSVTVTLTQLNNGDSIDGSKLPSNIPAEVTANGVETPSSSTLINGQKAISITPVLAGDNEFVSSVYGVTTSVSKFIYDHYDDVYVSTEGNDDNTGIDWENAVRSISAAIATVNDGGVIHLADGTYTVSPTTLSKNVEFVGESQNGTVIDGGSRAGFTINNGKIAKFSEMTFTAFAGNYGGVFEVNGILCVENVTFKNNRANQGGSAIDIGGATGSINVTNCYFDSNYAGRDGGALSSYDYGEVNVVNSTFINCSAGRNGGAIAIKSGNNYYKVVGCTFIDDYCTNLGNSYGGAIYAWSSNFIVDDCIFDNCSGQWGGAIGADGSSWTLSTNITGCLFMDNVNAVKGGAIYIDCFNTVNINYNVFVNSAASYGSADHTVISSGSKTKTSINLDNNWFGCNATEFDSSVLASSFAAPSEWLVVTFTPAGSVPVDESVEVVIDVLHNQNGEKIDASLIPSFIPNVLVSATNGFLNVEEIDLIEGENTVVFTAVSTPEGTVIADIGGKINEGAVVITKGATEISIDVSPVAGDDGNDRTITVSLPENVKGSVQLILVSPTLGDIVTIELPENSYTFTDLPAGDYVIETILFSDDYFPAIASTEFTVSKLDVDASISVEPTVKFNETLDVVINGLYPNLDTSKIVITDNGNILDVELVDGIASYVPATTGDHNIVVSFAGDDNYNPFDISASFTVTSDGIIAINPGDNASKALNDAIASANAGDVIFLGDNNVYDDLSGIELKDGVTILGGENTVVKAADGASSVFTANSNASNVTIKNLIFVADKNDTSLLAIATKDLEGGISEVPEVSISGVTVELAEGVDAETISILNVNSTTSTFKPSNDVSVNNNVIVTGVKSLKTNKTSSDGNVDLAKVIATSLSGASSQKVYAIAYSGAKSGKYYSVTLKDANGNVLANKNIKFTFNGKTVTAKTNAKGVAKLAINVAKAGTYALTASFDDASYGSSSVKAKVKILKNKVKITRKTKKVKKSSKKRTLKYYVKTITGKKVGIKGVKVYLKVNKKTYKAKTNKKGLAKFKVKLPKVKKTYKVKVTFKGNKANKKKTLKTKVKVY